MPSDILCCISFLLLRWIWKWPSIFSAATDVFSVSLAAVAPSYVWLLLGATFSHFAFRHPELGNVYYVETLSDESRETILPFMISFSKIIIAAFALLAFISSVLMIIYKLKSGFFEFGILSVTLNIIILISSLSLINRFSLSKTQYDVIYLGLTVFSSLAMSGLRDAQRDKYLGYEEYDFDRFVCDDTIVLRTVSDYTLGIKSDNTRVLMDKECQIIYILKKDDDRSLPSEAPIDVIMSNK